MAGPPAAPSRAPAGRWVRPSPALGALEAVAGTGDLAVGLPPGLDAFGPLVGRLARGQPVDEARSSLVDEAAAASVRPGLDVVCALPRVRARPLPYQLQTATAALRRLHGRAILADDPGLGKGFEASLVLGELRARAMAGRALVLAPGSLVPQWEEELERTFSLPTVLATPAWQRHPAPAGTGADDGVGDRPSDPVVVTSLAAAVRSPLREALVAEPWDVVIVDEAHRAKSARSASGRLLRALTARRVLLLTATPVEESPDDLVQLAAVVRPGRVDGQVLRWRAGVAGQGELRARLRDVMVRHRRGEVPAVVAGRVTETHVVPPGAEEADLYAAVARRCRAESRSAPPERAPALRDALRRTGSSPQAAAPALARLGWTDLEERAASIPVAAAHRALVEVVAGRVRAGERAFVVSAFRESVDALGRHLAEAGVPTSVLHPALSRHEKDEVVRRFASGAGVLLTTERAGEGRDLRTCRLLVNADLPWDPLQLDRRIARLQRIGQPSDVVVATFVMRATVEERLLRVLEARLGVADLVAGETESVVARMGEDADVAAEVFAAHAGSADDLDAAARLDALGEELARARAAYAASRARTDELVGGVVP